MTIEYRDLVGNLVYVIDAAGGKIFFRYDLQGNLTTTIAAKGTYTDKWGSAWWSPAVTTTIRYDLLGRKTSMNDQDSGNWAYWYDALGQLRKQRAPSITSKPFIQAAPKRMTNTTPMTRLVACCLGTI